MLPVLSILAASSLAVAQEGFVQVGGSSSTPDYYVIQPGDTLWDISTRFLGDPYQWPQLWSYNEYITNPHWIYPGNRIYFRLGDSLSPPSAVVETVEDIPYQPPDEQVAVVDETCDYPPAFNDTRRGQRLTAPGLLGSPDDFAARGKLMWSQSGGESLSETDYIHLRMDANQVAECGDIVGIWRPVSGRVARKGVRGRVYRAVATARVIRVDDRVATAVIRDSFVEARRGDLVGDAIPVDVTVDVRAPRGDVEAEVVARLNSEVALAGTYETVFINRGTSDGVDVGTALYLVSQRDGRADLTSRDDQRLPERVVGRVVVVRAGEDHATAVVVDAARELMDGQRVVSTPNDEK